MSSTGAGARAPGCVVCIDRKVAMGVPIHEYRCRKCGQEFEVLLWGYNDDGPTKCDHCGGKLEKLLSTAAVIYKGSGFYTTDYCRKSGGNGDGAKSDWKEKAEEIKSGASSSDEKKTEKTETTKKK